MKCNEIIDQPLLPLGEGRFNSYEELLDKEALDNEKTQEHEWVERQWSNTKTSASETPPNKRHC